MSLLRRELFVLRGKRHAYRSRCFVYFEGGRKCRGTIIEAILMRSKLYGLKGVQSYRRIL